MNHEIAGCASKPKSREDKGEDFCDFDACLMDLIRWISIGAMENSHADGKLSGLSFA